MIGNRIKELRIKANLTQEDLANSLFVSRSLIAKWEQERAIPQEEYINKICVILKCSENDIYGYKDIEESQKKIHQYNYLLIFSIIILIIMLLLSTILGIYVNQKKYYESSKFSSTYLKDWQIENLFMPNNTFIDKPEENRLVYLSTYDEYMNYCNYLYNYLSFNPNIENLYYLDNIDKPNRICYFKIANNVNSCFIDENLYNVYYVNNNTYYVISIFFDTVKQLLTIRLSSDLILEESSPKIQIDYYSIFEDIYE